MCLRGLQWWALPLEEAIGCGLGSTSAPPSAASTSIVDTSPNFELLSGVITILTGPEVASQFEPFKLKVPYTQLVHVLVRYAKHCSIRWFHIVQRLASTIYVCTYVQ